MISLVEQSLQCVLLTPEGKIFEGPVDFLVVPLHDGELGIGRGRRELVATLAPGELRLRQGQSVLRFYVEEGFVEVLQNQVRVLARTVLRPDEIDAEKVFATLDELTRQVCPTEEQHRAREALWGKLRKQLQVFRRS
jgi:F-type H+-transporting ATPase subunit epsilon